MITRFKTLATALLVSSGLVLGSAGAYAQAANPNQPATAAATAASQPQAIPQAGTTVKPEGKKAEHKAAEKKAAEKKADAKKHDLKKAEAKKDLKAAETPKKGVN